MDALIGRRIVTFSHAHIIFMVLHGLAFALWVGCLGTLAESHRAVTHFAGKIGCVGLWI
jgi:hypothetical protein